MGRDTENSHDSNMWANGVLGAGSAAVNKTLLRALRERAELFPRKILDRHFKKGTKTVINKRIINYN